MSIVVCSPADLAGVLPHIPGTGHRLCSRCKRLVDVSPSTMASEPHTYLCLLCVRDLVAQGKLQLDSLTTLAQ